MNMRCSRNWESCAGKRGSLNHLAITLLLVVPAICQAATSNALGVSPSNPAAGSTSAQPDTAGIPGGAWKPHEAPKIVLPPLVDSDTAKQLADKWGVSLLSLSLSAKGYMLDFRFRVLDVDKALPLFDSRNAPYVQVERSKVRLPVPVAAKVGAFRPTNRGRNIKADKNYYIMFANPDHYVKAGEKVQLVIGDFKVDRLTVY